MNHAYFCHGGCHGGYKLQFDFSKSTKPGVDAEISAAEREEKEKSGEEEPRVSARLGSPSASAGYQLAIRALIAFECNVAENFI